MSTSLQELLKRTVDSTTKIGQNLQSTFTFTFTKRTQDKSMLRFQSTIAGPFIPSS